MAKAPSITVDAALVEWARTSAGLPVKKLAKRLGVTESVLEGWERTGAQLSARRLERLADATKRPLAAFFLPEPPQEPKLPDFRLPPADGAALVTSSETLLAIRRARRLQHLFVEIAKELGEAAGARLARIEPNDSPEVAAGRAREVVGVSVADQSGWKDAEAALKVWRSRLEGLGVLVFQFAMPPEEVSGFSLFNGVPAIALNRKDHHARRVFTLFHEWGHLLRGEAGLCEVMESQGRENAQEIFCNAFAGAFLVPLKDLGETTLFRDLRAGRVSIERAATEGGRLFSVSRHVVLRRLLTAQVISREAYRRTVEAWEKAPRREKKKAKGGAPPYLMTVSELGTRFVSRVLTAHERGLIGDADVADYLSLRLKHLDRVQALVPVA